MQKEHSIRIATTHDIPAMTGLLQELFSIEADFTPRPEVQTRGLERFLEDMENRTILVAEAHGQVLGMITAQILISTAEGGPSALVEDMVVSSGHRGQGIGQDLLQALATWAKQRDISRLQLLADRNNHPALRFYERTGWARTELICLRTRTTV